MEVLRIEEETANFSKIGSREISCRMFTVVHATKSILTTTSASRSVIRLPIRVTFVSQGSIIAIVMCLTASRILITQTVRSLERSKHGERNVHPELTSWNIASMVRLSLQSHAHQSFKPSGKLSMKVANCRLRIRFTITITITVTVTSTVKRP